MDRIESAKNPAAQRLKALNTAKGRSQSGLLLVEGEKMIREALSCGMRPDEVVFDEKRMDLMEKLAEELSGARLLMAPQHVLSGICDTVTPQGVCASFTLPSPMRELPERIVALDGVQDPGNVGTIWRTADAAGFQGILLSEKCADPAAPKVQRSSMGSTFRLPGERCDLTEKLTELKKQGYQLAAASLSGQDTSHFPGLSGKICLIIGSEAHGVRQEILNLCDMNLKIPMRGGAESLNAAVAAGIMMYAIWKG